MSKNKPERPVQINIIADDSLVSALREIKKVTHIPKSQFIRDAIWEKIASTKQTHPAFQFVSANLSAEMPNK